MKVQTSVVLKNRKKRRKIDKIIKRKIGEWLGAETTKITN